MLIESGSACWDLQIRDYRTEAGVVGRSLDLSSEGVRKRCNLARGTAKSMIRHRTREREAVLDYVKSIHVVFRRAHSASRSECAHRSEIALAAVEKIAIERKDHIRAIESRQEA